MKEIRTQSERKLKSYHSREALLLFTDASETHWALIILQTPYEEVNLQDIKAMKPEPMMFLSGKFAKTEMNWHISQKEMYPLVYAFKRVQIYNGCYMAIQDPSFSFIDHRNLKFAIKPKLCDKRKHVESLRRWALLFRSADVVVTHKISADNFGADLKEGGAPLREAARSTDAE